MSKYLKFGSAILYVDFENARKGPKPPSLENL